MALPDGTTVAWYGHSVVRIDTARGKTVIIDPFFANPGARSRRRPSRDATCCW